MQTVTLGGDRLGSGNKNKIALRNYERSTHNLSQNWASSMGPGMLLPFLCIPAMRGDSFEIDLEAAARTIPTQGPLFGSFKMQIDVFQCPFRLYQAILHNNPTAIGLKMNQVKFPMLQVLTKVKDKQAKEARFSNNSLLKYLGYSGLGRCAAPNTNYIGRQINAIPVLAYYDIFKNYYANKQEQYAYAIGIEETPEDEATMNDIAITNKINWTTEHETPYENKGDLFSMGMPYENPIVCAFDVAVKGRLNPLTQIQIIVKDEEGNEIDAGTIQDINTNSAMRIFHGFTWNADNVLSFSCEFNQLKAYLTSLTEETLVGWNIYNTNYTISNKITTSKLIPFDLKNIDDMRLALLSYNNLGTHFKIGTSIDCNWEGDATDADKLPYSLLVSQTTDDEITHNHYALNGVMLKTYQSDLYNNWINTEWIDGENGIAEVTKIAVTEGAFKIDALNLAEKLYNMLNRIAVSGGTYEDWQDAVYTQSPRRHIESPVYLGGMSNEVVFEEIVQTAPAEGEPLGTLGGRGILVKRKGGNIDVKVDEASFIIGIVSLTPRIYQTQGNEWYLTDLLTMDDLHKPALDGIGFQNLIGEQMAWFDTVISPNSTAPLARSVVGKVPAWINYMTAVDKAFGDFADDSVEGTGFMVLSRRYEQDESSGEVKDFTTYVDPAKYNYAFAYTKLDAQNFWVQIKTTTKARRLMSAKQIPNV